jgi:SAM-dependent methyltransferase
MMDLSAFYDRSFFERHVPWRAEYEAIADMLAARLTFLSVIDMGCGNGFIIARLAQLGKKVTGIDGSLHAIAAAPPEIRPRLMTADLTQPLRLGHYDLVICSEVAEHLEAHHAAVLVDTICSNSAGLVFFTAATPGQVGHGHVNEQPHDYWIAMFAQRGFRLDAASTSSLRDDLSKRINMISWFTDNALIFRCSRLWCVRNAFARILRGFKRHRNGGLHRASCCGCGPLLPDHLVSDAASGMGAAQPC